MQRIVLDGDGHVDPVSAADGLRKFFVRFFKVVDGPARTDHQRGDIGGFLAAAGEEEADGAARPSRFGEPEGELDGIGCAARDLREESIGTAAVDALDVQGVVPDLEHGGFRSRGPGREPGFRVVTDVGKGLPVEDLARGGVFGPRFRRACIDTQKGGAKKKGEDDADPASHTAS